MKNIQLYLLLFLLGGLTFSSCNLEEDPIPNQEEILYNIKDNFRDWISSFDRVNEMITYKNSEDSIVQVVVERTFDLTERSYINCRYNDQVAQCESESINLAFPANTHPDNFQVYVSIFIFGPEQLRIMANRVGIDPSLALFEDDPEEITSEIEDNFEASYDANFTYNSVNSPAVILETISLENVVIGAIIPPSRMVLVKGFGLVEWDDYNGNTWILQN